MDEYGTIYFKNDSAYLMAVGSTIERIEVTKLPDKTTYKVKDTFDPTGMQVTAYYANGKTRDITDYVTWSETPLTANDTDFQITFPYAMYQNRENSDTLEMEYGVHCDKPMTTLTLTIEDTTEVKYGDVNGDGKVASTDAAIVYRYANGKYQLSANQLLAADVNGDGKVNIIDLMQIAQYIVGVEGASGADVNGDGKANILDLMLVAQYIVGADADSTTTTTTTTTTFATTESETLPTIETIPTTQISYEPEETTTTSITEETTAQVSYETTEEDTTTIE